MSTRLTITAKQARRLLLAQQGLCRAPTKKVSSADLDNIIQQLGYVQLDSVKTVERAHHMILHARSQTYRPSLLEALHAPPHRKDVRLFENWTHDASLIPIEFYPFWQAKFRREAEVLKSRFNRWHQKSFDTALDHVRKRIEDEGPLMARHFNEGAQNQSDRKPRKDTGDKSGGWWDWRSSKIALEYLWRTGGLAVAKRDGFQKVYDLTERVIPAPFYVSGGSIPDDGALIDWACRQALKRLVFGSPGEIARYFDLITPKEAKTWCEAQPNSTLCRIVVEAFAGKETLPQKPKTVFALPDIEERIKVAPDAPKRVRVLSPFDPVMRDRTRLKHLFGFDYRIEIFVPEAQRKYGYYVFPLLEGDQMIGRVDMTGVGRETLAVTNLWLEEAIRPSKGRQEEIHAAISRVAALADLVPPEDISLP